MDIITLDFETYFDSDYTLKKMTTEAYVRDPRFEVLGCGIRGKIKRLGRHYKNLPNDEKETWFPAEEFDDVCLGGIDWDNTALLCHHAHFDGLILSHHFGFKPKYWLDTLSMARLVLGTHVSASLGSLSKHYGLAEKNVPYDLFRGKHWQQLDAQEQQLVSEGCLHDLALTYDIFKRLAVDFPPSEYPIVDMTVRMFTEPKLLGDTQILGKLWWDEEIRKGEALKALGVRDADLQSAAKFAELLKAESVEPEFKEGKNGPIYAFAKTDDFMRALVEDENPRVSLLARTRLGIKSTIDQTRAERLGNMAMRGPMCVYLNYCGAHTTRWSGGDKVNWQNFRRGGQLRKAITAPPGYKLITADSSQIECRILNYLAGQWNVIERFKSGQDPYTAVASYFYGFEVNKKDHPKERQLGKVIELACGYGMGAEKLKNTLKNEAIILDDIQALHARDAYRDTHPQVVNYWSTASKMISRLASKDYPQTEWGPMLIKAGKIYGPGGAFLNFETLTYDEDWKAWKTKKRQGWSKLYGGKLVENIVQWLARIFIAEVMVSIKKQLPNISFVLCTHDEIVACVSDNDDIHSVLDVIKREMVSAPMWAQQLPLACEAFISERYEK